MLTSIKPLTDEIIQAARAGALQPHRHPYQEIVLLNQGGGTHLIDGERQELEAPVALLIAQGKLHLLTPRAGSRGWIINFDQDLLPPDDGWAYYQFFAASRVALARTADCHHVVRLATLMHEIQVTGGAGATGAVTHLLLAILQLLQLEFQAMAMHQAQASQADFRLLNGFLTLLERHFRTEKEVGFYIRELRTTARHLAGLARSFLGRTTVQLIEERCVHEARQQLVFTDKPIKAIAAELGYQDSSYFAKVFHKSTREAPSAFRRARQALPAPTENYPNLASISR